MCAIYVVTHEVVIHLLHIPVNDEGIIAHTLITVTIIAEELYIKGTVQEALVV